MNEAKFLEVGRPTAADDRKEPKARPAGPHEGARRLQEAAIAVIERIVAPKVKRVASELDAVLVCPHSSARHSCTCILRPTPDCPAYVNLSFFLCHDRRFRSGVLRYVLEVDPSVFDYEAQDVLVFPLDCVPPEQIAAWVDEKLVAFALIYDHLRSSLAARRVKRRAT